jgi:hypothetical protein
MPCPFLEEILMAYCRAYPVRKLVPKCQITTGSTCTAERYMDCPFFKEITARMHSPPGETPGLIGQRNRKEVT